MSVMMDYRSGQQHSISPFYGAGTAHMIDVIHRNEGKVISAQGLVEDISSVDNENDGNKIVRSASVQGISGYTKYQGSVEMVEIPLEN